WENQSPSYVLEQLTEKPMEKLLERNFSDSIFQIIANVKSPIAAALFKLKYPDLQTAGDFVRAAEKYFGSEHFLKILMEVEKELYQINLATLDVTQILDALHLSANRDQIAFELANALS